jgi:sugar lactone lactonase YvrE
MPKVEVAVSAQSKLGECPRWHRPTQSLYWVDINAFQLHRYNLAKDEHQYLQFAEEIGCFAFRENGGFILAMRSGFYLLEGWNTDLTFIADPESDLPISRFNDGRCDAIGRFFAGTYYSPKDWAAANLWCLDEQKSVSKIHSGLLTTNGVAFSPDSKIIYFSDTPKHCIYRAEYDLQTGTVAEPEVFYQFPHGNGRPDGASVDVEGCYWVALYEGGRIVKINPAGKIEDEISVPARCPTMVAFGGEDLTRLFVTSVGERPDDEREHYPHSGDIFKIDVDIAGMPEYNFCF